VIDDHPGLQFVLDHCAKPRLAGGDLAAWKNDIAEIARRPNIVCKLSGLVTEATADWQVADLRPAVDHVRACFGSSRLLWGSDWPVVNLFGGYARWLAAAETLLTDLSEEERARVFGDNAARVYLSNRGRRPAEVLFAGARCQSADDVAFEENSDQDERNDRRGR
jgi:L-fuconolactonase